MKFFIDTADLGQIKEARDLGVLDGVTTIHSLMAKDGVSGEKNIFKHYEAICEIVDGDVSADVLATEFEKIVEEGSVLSKIADNIVDKVPMIKDGLKAIRALTDEGIPVNTTLVFSAGQAILAAKADSAYGSAFLVRICDITCEGMNMHRELADIYAIRGYA